MYMILCANHSVSPGLHLGTSFDCRKVCDSCDHRHDHTILTGQTARVDRIVRTLWPSPKVGQLFTGCVLGTRPMCNSNSVVVNDMASFK